MLISEEYRALNAKQHVDDDCWGRQAVKNWEAVKTLVDYGGAKTILDYGCGKGMLGEVLRSAGYNVTDYDPALPGKEMAPAPHDFVCCLDVLEHVEPDCLAAVLADLRRVTKDALFVIVATRPSRKTLPDGTNPHRIIEPYSWWKTRLEEHFIVAKVNEKPERVFAALLVPKDNT